MATFEKALRIAAEAHEGQQDKSGGHYVWHPLRVMRDVSGGKAEIVAVLHDVVEDTDYEFSTLAAEGFDAEILDALRCVTHLPDESYADYVIRCSANPLAREVKLADLRDNAQLPRVLARYDKIESDLQRVHRYVLSYKFLTDQITQPQYLELMAQYG